MNLIIYSIINYFEYVERRILAMELINLLTKIHKV